MTKKKRPTVKVTVVQKSVFGSLTAEHYGDDNLANVRDWIDDLLAKIPEEYRDATYINVESVGGYEGEHHTEIEVYYERPETDAEQAAREADEKARRDYQEERERTMLAQLQAKYQK